MRRTDPKVISFKPHCGVVRAGCTRSVALWLTDTHVPQAHVLVKFVAIRRSKYTDSFEDDWKTGSKKGIVKKAVRLRNISKINKKEEEKRKMSTSASNEGDEMGDTDSNISLSSISTQTSASLSVLSTPQSASVSSRADNSICLTKGSSSHLHILSSEIDSIFSLSPSQRLKGGKPLKDQSDEDNSLIRDTRELFLSSTSSQQLLSAVPDEISHMNEVVDCNYKKAIADVDSLFSTSASEVVENMDLRYREIESAEMTECDSLSSLPQQLGDGIDERKYECYNLVVDNCKSNSLQDDLVQGIEMQAAAEQEDISVISDISANDNYYGASSPFPQKNIYTRATTNIIYSSVKDQKYGHYFQVDDQESIHFESSLSTQDDKEKQCNTRTLSADSHENALSNYLSTEGCSDISTGYQSGQENICFTSFPGRDNSSVIRNNSTCSHCKETQGSFVASSSFSFSAGDNMQISTEKQNALQNSENKIEGEISSICSDSGDVHCEVDEGCCAIEQDSTIFLAKSQATTKTENYSFSTHLDHLDRLCRASSNVEYVGESSSLETQPGSSCIYIFGPHASNAIVGRSLALRTCALLCSGKTISSFSITDCPFDSLPIVLHIICPLDKSFMAVGPTSNVDEEVANASKVLIEDRFPIMLERALNMSATSSSQNVNAECWGWDILTFYKVFFFEKVKHLVLSKTQMQCFGGKLGLNKFEYLESLDLSNNKLEKIDKSIDLPHLKYLNLSGNFLTSLDYIQPLVNLNVLNVSKNKLCSLHCSLHMLVSLSGTLYDLNMSGNGVCADIRYAEEAALLFPMLKMFDGVDIRGLNHYLTDDSVIFRRHSKVTQNRGSADQSNSHRGAEVNCSPPPILGKNCNRTEGGLTSPTKSPPVARACEKDRLRDGKFDVRKTAEEIKAGRLQRVFERVRRGHMRQRKDCPGLPQLAGENCKLQLSTELDFPVTPKGLSLTSEAGNNDVQLSSSLRQGRESNAWAVAPLKYRRENCPISPSRRNHLTDSHREPSYMQNTLTASFKLNRPTKQQIFKHRSLLQQTQSVKLRQSFEKECQEKILKKRGKFNRYELRRKSVKDSKHRSNNTTGDDDISESVCPSDMSGNDDRITDVSNGKLYSLNPVQFDINNEIVAGNASNVLDGQSILRVNGRDGWSLAFSDDHLFLNQVKDQIANSLQSAIDIALGDEHKSNVISGVEATERQEMQRRPRNGMEGSLQSERSLHLSTLKNDTFASPLRQKELPTTSTQKNTCTSDPEVSLSPPSLRKRYGRSCETFTNSIDSVLRTIPKAAQIKSHESFNSDFAHARPRHLSLTKTSSPNDGEDWITTVSATENEVRIIRSRNSSSANEDSGATEDLIYSKTSLAAKLNAMESVVGELVQQHDLSHTMDDVNNYFDVVQVNGRKSEGVAALTSSAISKAEKGGECTDCDRQVIHEKENFIQKLDLKSFVAMKRKAISDSTVGKGNHFPQVITTPRRNIQRTHSFSDDEETSIVELMNRLYDEVSPFHLQSERKRLSSSDNVAIDEHELLHHLLSEELNNLNELDRTTGVPRESKISRTKTGESVSIDVPDTSSRADFIQASTIGEKASKPNLMHRSVSPSILASLLPEDLHVCHHCSPPMKDGVRTEIDGPSGSGRMESSVQNLQLSEPSNFFHNPPPRKPFKTGILRSASPAKIPHRLSNKPSKIPRSATKRRAKRFSETVDSSVHERTLSIRDKQNSILSESPLGPKTSPLAYDEKLPYRLHQSFFDLLEKDSFEENTNKKMTSLLSPQEYQKAPKRSPRRSPLASVSESISLHPLVQSPTHEISPPPRGTHAALRYSAPVNVQLSSVDRSASNKFSRHEASEIEMDTDALYSLIKEFSPAHYDMEARNDNVANRENKMDAQGYDEKSLLHEFFNLQACEGEMDTSTQCSSIKESSPDNYNTEARNNNIASREKVQELDVGDKTDVWGSDMTCEVDVVADKQHHVMSDDINVASAVRKAQSTSAASSLCETERKVTGLTDIDEIKKEICNEDMDRYMSWLSNQSGTVDLTESSFDNNSATDKIEDSTRSFVDAPEIKVEHTSSLTPKNEQEGLNSLNCYIESENDSYSDDFDPEWKEDAKVISENLGLSHKGNTASCSSTAKRNANDTTSSEMSAKILSKRPTKLHAPYGTPLSIAKSYSLSVEDDFTDCSASTNSPLPLGSVRHPRLAAETPSQDDQSSITRSSALFRTGST